jgi:sugar (pentulose or hexulose) kinase
LLDIFDDLTSGKNLGWNKLKDILPKVSPAGEHAGHLHEAGALLLDPSGNLKAGIPLCPPEGDAGTGMVATNSIQKRTGNISASTSIFAMLVLEKDLSAVYPEIDIINTPDGNPVAMVLANNCSSDMNAWVSLFAEFYQAMGFKPDTSQIFNILFNKAMEADEDGGGLLSYYSAETSQDLQRAVRFLPGLPKAGLTWLTS